MSKTVIMQSTVELIGSRDPKALQAMGTGWKPKEFNGIKYNIKDEEPGKEV